MNQVCTLVGNVSHDVDDSWQDEIAAVRWGDIDAVGDRVGEGIGIRLIRDRHSSRFAFEMLDRAFSVSRAILKIRLTAWNHAAGCQKN